MFMVHDLARTIHGVATEWQVDDTMFILGYAFHDGEVFLFDDSLSKLLLQRVIGFLCLSHEDNARCRHVQSMGYHRTWPTLLCPCGYGVGFLPPWHAEHPRWFVDDDHCLVFIHDLCSQMRGTCLFGTGIDIESLHHPRQYWLAFASTGRVELLVMTDQVLRTFAPPELCHANGLQPLFIGILQQFGCTTVACASWWQWKLSADALGAVVILPYVHQILCLTPRVQ